MKPQKCMLTTYHDEEKVCYKLPTEDVEAVLFQNLSKSFPEIKGKCLILNIQPSIKKAVVFAYHKNKVPGRYEQVTQNVIFSLELDINIIIKWLNLPKNLSSVHHYVYFNKYQNVQNKSFYLFEVGKPESFPLKKNKGKYTIDHLRPGYLLPVKKTEEKIFNHLSKKLPRLRTKKAFIRKIGCYVSDRIDITLYTQEITKKDGILKLSTKKDHAIIRMPMEDFCSLLGLPEPILSSIQFACIKNNRIYCPTDVMPPRIQDYMSMPRIQDYRSINREKSYWLLIPPRKREEYDKLTNLK